MPIKDLMQRRADEATNADILYHYTDQNGFLGILNSGEIWATGIRYLNDSDEFEGARRAMIESLDRRLEDHSSTEREDLQRVRTIVSAEVAPGKAFVASLSAAEDDLCQWRAYANGVGGLALGFSRSTLIQRLPSADLWPCAYEETDRNSIIEQFTEDALRLMSEFRRSARPNAWEDFKDLTAAHFVQTAPLLKHRAFKNEREWRFVVPAHWKGTHTVFHRSGPSMMRPYIKLRLAADADLPSRPTAAEPAATPRLTWAGRIVRVIVGPTPHRELALEAARARVEEAGLDGNIVRGTDVPYRGW